MYYGITSKAKLIPVRKAYTRKLRLLERIPDQQMREVKTPAEVAVVDKISLSSLYV